MLDQGLYNYYLKEVLGLDHYIGSPQQALSFNESSVSFESQTLVISENDLSTDENELLVSIMKAVKQAEYQHLLSKDFNLKDCSNCNVLILKNNILDSDNVFVPTHHETNTYIVSIELSEMLAPTNAEIIKINKQKLWQALKKAFKV